MKEKETKDLCSLSSSLLFGWKNKLWSQSAEKQEGEKSFNRSLCKGIWEKNQKNWSSQEKNGKKRKEGKKRRKTRKKGKKKGREIRGRRKMRKLVA